MKRQTGVPLLTAIAALFGISACASSGQIPAAEARLHLGEHRTVCGTVASTRFDPSAGGGTFLHFERPEPDQPFTAVISPELRSKFLADPVLVYRDAGVCVTGTIQPGGAPRIYVRDLNQIYEE